MLIYIVASEGYTRPGVEGEERGVKPCKSKVYVDLDASYSIHASLNRVDT